MSTRTELQNEANYCKTRGRQCHMDAALARDHAAYFDSAAKGLLERAAALERQIDDMAGPISDWISHE